MRVTDPSLSAEQLQQLIISANWASLQYRLSRGIAHALGGPLQSLMLALPDHGEPPPSPEETGFIAEVAGSAMASFEPVVRVSAGLAGYAPNGEPGPVHLGDLINELFALRPYLHVAAQARITTTLPADLPAVRGVTGELSHALLALFVNACEAADTGFPELRIEAFRTADDLHLTVWDHGSGFPAALGDGVFAPFTTTKAPPHRGLGLSAARLLVERHGGRLAIGPREPGGVTSVVMTLSVWSSS